jgi:DNA-binding transcriptional MerR regulator
MVTLEDIQKQTGVSINTIQYWRRQQNEGLLPEPVAVRKKVIYFNDSIIERIQFIKARLEDGIRLPDIKELLHKKDEEELIAKYDPHEALDDDGGYSKRMDALDELEKKWDNSNRKNDVCLALALDPAISGQPSLSVTGAWSYDTPIEVFASIVSNGWVHFAKLHVDTDGDADIKVKAQAKIEVAAFGMLLAIIGQKLAEDNQLMNSPSEIPSALFGGYETLQWQNAFGLDTLEEAKKLTKVLRAGQEFIKHL